MKSLSRVQLLATPWTAAYQVPPSVGFSRQEDWSGVSLPSPGVGCGRAQISPGCGGARCQLLQEVRAEGVEGFVSPIVEGFELW